MTHRRIALCNFPHRGLDRRVPVALSDLKSALQLNKEVLANWDASEAEELKGIQNFLSGTFVLQNSSRNGIIGQLRFVDLHGLDHSYLSEFVRRVHAVTPADVQRVARRYFNETNRTVLYILPKSGGSR